VKANNIPIRALIFSTLLASSGMAWAQSTATTTTTTSSTISSDGTVSSFTPDAMIVQSASSAPVTYSYRKTTTYVDENGNPVAVETVRSGVPVTVYYTRDGTGMVASKVVVHKVVTTVPTGTVIEKKTTTTTTTTSGP
jgi:hypothetical protein